MRRTGVTARWALAGAAAFALAGCGGQKTQDEDEPTGNYRLDVVRASFPTSQKLAQQSRFELEVRNAGQETVPNVAVTVQSADPGKSARAFERASEQEGLADPSRPIWVLDDGPLGATTAYVNTWALGRLKPGRTKKFTWKVTAVRSGTYTIRYKVSAGLDGKAKARTAAGEEPRSTVTVNISDRPAQSEIGPNGEVIKR